MRQKFHFIVASITVVAVFILCAFYYAQYIKGWVNLSFGTMVVSYLILVAIVVIFILIAKKKFGIKA